MIKYFKELLRILKSIDTRLSKLEKCVNVYTGRYSTYYLNTDRKYLKI